MEEQLNSVHQELAAGPILPENLDTVRDILFGPQMRNQDRRLARFEDKVFKEIDSIREQSHKAVETLEDFSKKEITLLVERMKVEQSHRAEALKQTSEQINDVAKVFEKRLAAIEELNIQAHRDVRHELHEQAKTLREEMQQVQKDFSGVVESAVKELRAAKTDRASLSKLFVELGQRLGDESQAGGQ